MTRNKVAQARRVLGMSQETLSRQARISVSWLSRVENGHMRPFPAWRRRIAEVLGCDEAKLFPSEQERGDG